MATNGVLAISVESMEIETYIATRKALHGVAELLLAGPQHAQTEHIRLRVVPGGFATAASPEVAILGSDVVAGETRLGLDGRSVRELADELSLTATDLSHVYRDVTGLDPNAPLAIDEAAAQRIADVYAIGDAALRAFAPDVEPILWPEHFDIAITVDDVNYGVTPGDSGLETPYMYVGPWSVPTDDDFWNTSFGAARPLADDPAGVVAFFEEGRSRLGR
jgi:hypothetical protein